ncbi:MAG TPA: PKD domain-containing protein [Spirochaetota bacterium]|nr:PKD domain-containing protein [Spirochaetota bacterium]
MSGTSVFGYISYLESRTRYSGKREFRLPKGTYSVGAYTSWLKNFSVESAGTVSYESQYEGTYFKGAGTDTVKVVGHEVQMSFTNPATVGGLYQYPFISDDGTGTLFYLPAGTYTIGSPQADASGNRTFIVNADGSLTYSDLVLNATSGYDIGDVNVVGLDDQPFEKITITSPINLSRFTKGANITLAASVENCNETPSKVEFLNGSILLGEDAEAPYELQLTSVPKGTYNILVKAVLPSGNTLVSSVIFYVDDVNHRPLALAGSDLNVNEGGTVTLDGSGSSDSDNDEIKYMWGQVSGPAVRLIDDDTAHPRFTAPEVGPGGANVVLRLLVSDTTSSSEADTVNVHISDTDGRNPKPLVDEPISSRTPYGISLWHMGRSVSYIDQFHQYLGDSLGSYMPADSEVPESSKRILIEPEMIDVDKTCGWYRYADFIASHNGDQGPTLDVPVMIPKKGLYRFWVRYGCKAGYAAATGITIYQEGNSQLGPVFTDRMYDSRASISGYDFKDFSVELQAGRYIIKFSHQISLTENTYLFSRYLDYIYITDELWADAPTSQMMQEIKSGTTMNYIQWTCPHLLSSGEKSLWKKWQVRPLNWDDRNDNAALFTQSLAFWRQKIDQLALAAHTDDNLRPERQIIFDDRWNMIGNPRRIAQRVSELTGSIDFNPSMTYEQYLQKAQNLGVDTGKEYMLWTPGDAFDPLAQNLWPTSMLPSGAMIINRTVPRESYMSQPIFIRSLRSQPANLNVTVNGGFPGSVTWRVISFTNVGSSDASDTWVPFQLMKRPSITVPPLNAAGIWLTVNTKGMLAGDYQYTITLSGEGVSTTNVQLNLHVSRASAVPDQPYLINPYTRPPEGEVYLKDFVEHDLNVWNTHYTEAMPKDYMGEMGIRDVHLQQWDPKEFEIQRIVDRMSDLGYSTNDWAVQIKDEPWRTDESGLSDYIEIINMFLGNDPGVRIILNPGGYASAATYEALDSYADLWIPYASHLNNPDMVSVFTQKPWTWYTTYVYYDKSPDASKAIYQQMRSIPAKPVNCVGTSFMAHYYLFSFNNAWDTAFEGWTDSALMLLPSRHGPVAAMPYEALREGVQHAHVAKQLKEHPDFVADEAGLELIANGSLADLLTTLESKMNIPPVASAGTDQTVHLGSIVTLDGSGSTDPDEKYPLAYSWTITEKPEGSAAVLTNGNSVSPSVLIDLPGNYTFRIIVTDATGVASEPAFVHVSTTNTAPVADAGMDRAVTDMGSAVLLDGTKSWDPDGDVVTYAWTITQKPDGSNAVLQNAASATPTLVPDIYGEYRVQLVASDPWISGTPDEVIVSFVNMAPVAVSGNNKSCLVNDIVLLDGSGSYDANGDTITYRWQIVSMPAGSQTSLSNATSAMPSIQPDMPGEYIVSLTVNDGAANSSPSTVSVVAISYNNAAVQLIEQAISLIDGLPDSYFKNKNMAKTLTKKINVIIVKIDEADYDGARNQLANDVLQKMDGYVNNGAPDNNDWIVDWPSQENAYRLVKDAADLLSNILVM